MHAITEFFVREINYLSTVTLWDIVDILIVAYLIYKIIGLVRRTSMFNLAKGLIILLLALWVSEIAHLTMINYLLRKAVEIGLIALVIIFQPELRKILARMGSGSFFQSKGRNTGVMDNAINQTVMACTSMSKSKTGALIIFERGMLLNDTMITGTMIDSEVSAELLKNIFYPKAPLHDGALIIRDARIAAAGCVLPLTTKTNLSKDLGMRHRAGIGLSEQYDAIVIIVSEETGAISVAIDGMLKRNLTEETFDALLRNELLVEKEQKKSLEELISRFKTKFKGDKL